MRVGRRVYNVAWESVFDESIGVLRELSESKGYDFKLKIKEAYKDERRVKASLRRLWSWSLKPKPMREDLEILITPTANEETEITVYSIPKFPSERIPTDESINIFLTLLDKRLKKYLK